jgi:hypothetical protein
MRHVCQILRQITACMDPRYMVTKHCTVPVPFMPYHHRKDSTKYSAQVLTPWLSPASTPTSFFYTDKTLRVWSSEDGKCGIQKLLNYRTVYGHSSTQSGRETGCHTMSSQKQITKREIMHYQIAWCKQVP